MLIDWYVYQAVKTADKELSETAKRVISVCFWSVTALSIGILLFVNFTNAYKYGSRVPVYLTVFVVAGYLSKIIVILFLLIDDLIRLGRWVVSLFMGKKAVTEALPAGSVPAEGAIPRSEFLAKAALISGAVPLVSMAYGVIIGAHDYHIRRINLKLPNLPSGFEGLKLLQLSDIHSGSFFNRKAVMGGIDMVMREKADLIFFTGDLVNNMASEMRDYQDIFSRVQAPLGVYSTLGNHDYGDYAWWASPEAKAKNLHDLTEVHRLMGWKLLMDEHHLLRLGADELAIIGIQNWGGKGRFPKYGRMDKAVKNMPEVPVQLLLSHDPSHWDMQVRPKYPAIDAVFAGHTHGMQFGVEIGGFQWSPVKYMYEQWGGLYTKGNQQLYVNRGFGFIGYPGRIGMPPEITVFTLTKG